METACLKFIVAANTKAPNSFTCEKIIHWPATAEALNIIAAFAKAGYEKKNAIAEPI